MGTIGNQEMVRVTNQNLILDLIKERGMISRADIAKTLYLSPPSISSNINCLLEMGLLREAGEGASSGGRKPILLELNKDYGYIVGIETGGEEVRISLGNICAEIIDTQYLEPVNDNSGVGLLINIMHSLNEMIEGKHISKGKIKVIAIAAPGVYDIQSKKMVGSTDMDWSDIDIGGALKAEYGAEIIIKNDISIAALGEYIFGLNKNCGNMLYINADNRIGAGMIINGELYEGSFGAAGIIRSMAFSREQIGGIYKKTGYLETSVSVDKLVRKIRNTCREDKQLIELCGGEIARLDFGVLKRAYEKNHMTVKNELEKVVDLISMAIGNINTVLNVDTIVLGGRMAALGEYFIISIKRVVGELCPFTPYIAYSVLKENAVIYGLLAAGQEHVLKSNLQQENNFGSDMV